MDPLGDLQLINIRVRPWRELPKGYCPIISGPTVEARWGERVNNE
jgi:hypothetical protein